MQRASKIRRMQMSDKMTIEEVEKWINTTGPNPHYKRFAIQLADTMRELKVTQQLNDSMQQINKAIADRLLAISKENEHIREKGSIDSIEAAYLKEENERLREALDKKGCVYCDSAKYYAIVGNPEESVMLPKVDSCK